MTWEWYVFGILAGLVLITLITLLTRKKKPVQARAAAASGGATESAPGTEPARAGAAAPAGIHADAAAGGSARAGHEYFPLVFQDDPYYRQRQQGYAAVPPPAQAYAYAPYEGPDRRQNRGAFAYGGEERRRTRPDYIHDDYPADYAAGYADARREADAADNAATRELLNQILREARENRTNRARSNLYGDKSTAQLLREVLQEVQQPQPQGYGVPVQQGYAPVPVVQTPAPAPVQAVQQPQQTPGSPVTVNLTVPGNAPALAPVPDPVYIPISLDGERTFLITRKEIAEETRRTEPAVEVVMRPDNPTAPISLKIHGRTYAMLYTTDENVSMIVRIPDFYAATVARSHPNVHRAKWPHGPEWYLVLVDRSFSDKAAVFNILSAARSFVSGERL